MTRCNLALLAGRDEAQQLLADEVERWCDAAAASGHGPDLPEELGRRLDRVRIRTLGDLVLCDQLLDALGMASLNETAAYGGLERKARTFVLAHPDLLSEPWLRAGGAIFDLLAQLKGETHHADLALERFRLRPQGAMAYALP